MAVFPARSVPLTIGLLVALLAPHAGPATATVELSLGDVDCDSVVGAVDAELVLQFEASLTDSLPCQDAANAYLDGEIDSRDAALVLQFSARMVDSLPPLVEVVGTLQAGVETCMGLETESGWLSVVGHFEDFSIGQRLQVRGYLRRPSVGFCPFPELKALWMSKVE